MEMALYSTKCEFLFDGCVDYIRINASTYLCSALECLGRHFAGSEDDRFCIELGSEF